VRLISLLVFVLLGTSCTAVAMRGEGEPAQHPLRAIGTLPPYAQLTPVVTSIPVRATPVPDQRDIIRDTGTATERVVEVVRDNDGRAWLARDGSAVWMRTSDGLVLERLGGGSLERIEGAREIREAPGGSARAALIGDAWTIEAGGRMVRLVGAQFPSFSFDGRYLAYERSSSDGRVRTVIVLDTRSGEEIVAAPGIGRCHCTTIDAYGFPRWATTTAAFNYGDSGPFDAPPEERERLGNGQFLYDLATRRATRGSVPSQPRAGCEQRATLTSSDGAYELSYTRSCRLPRF